MILACLIFSPYITITLFNVCTFESNSYLLIRWTCARHGRRSHSYGTHIRYSIGSMLEQHTTSYGEFWLKNKLGTWNAYMNVYMNMYIKCMLGAYALQWLWKWVCAFTYTLAYMNVFFSYDMNLELRKKNKMKWILIAYECVCALWIRVWCTCTRYIWIAEYYKGPQCS